MYQLVAPVNILAVIVLYKMQVTDSPTYRSILKSLEQVPKDHLRLKILLYDNSPQTTAPPIELPKNVQYRASKKNMGLADAYNTAVDVAYQEGFEWILTLDQDTELPLDFLGDITTIALEQGNDSNLAAIVPHITSDQRTVSPNWFRWGMLPVRFTKDFTGIPDRTVYAFNSASTVRVSAILEIGGYSPLFWLDNCDTYLYCHLAKAGKKIFVAGHIHVDHDFSMLDIKNRMSLSRFENALETGSVFRDIEWGWLAGIEYTSRLFRIYARQVLKGDDAAFRRVTLAIIKKRLGKSKQRRIAEWKQKQCDRIASYSEKLPKSATNS
jgi:GT2 family glycosyltransferase